MNHLPFAPNRPNKLVVLTGLILLLSACAALRPHSPPAQPLEPKIEIPGMPGVRAWGDEFSPEFQRDILESVDQEKRSGLFKEGDTVSLLAISGGGGDGAFGAGLLYGWSESGARPSFKMVTGVSTGALTAPFAFLGPAYDQRLKQVYTTITANDVFMLKSVIAMLQSDAMTLSDPLADLTAEYVDDQMLRDVAAEHRKGRRLYICTTALDAQRPVIWNMGAIAASGHPDAPRLFRKVMMASAAVPVAFPPVYIKVTAPDGRQYDEMHVDGGVTHQVFLMSTVFDTAKLRDILAAGPQRHFRAYVLRNSRISPSWQDVTPLMQSIAPRSIQSLIKAQGVGDLYRIYATTQRDGIDFNLAYIPDQMNTNRSDEFDSTIMSVLFDTGYKLARKGYRWQKAPPGFLPVKDETRRPAAMPAAAPRTGSAGGSP